MTKILKQLNWMKELKNPNVGTEIAELDFQKVILKFTTKICYYMYNESSILVMISIVLLLNSANRYEMY